MPITHQRMSAGAPKCLISIHESLLSSYQKFLDELKARPSSEENLQLLQRTELLIAGEETAVHYLKYQTRMPVEELSYLLAEENRKIEECNREHHPDL